jgi:multiple sugar transport system permease protein
MATATADATSSPRVTPRRRRRGIRILARKDKIVIVFMLGVPLLLDLGFVWFPALASVVLSFTKWSGIGGLRKIRWIGFQNYHQAATIYPPFWPAIRHNIIWLTVFLAIATPLGMLFAVLLDRGMRGSRVYQSIFFLPVMLSLALIGIIWELIYSQNFGLINNVIGRASNTNAIDWLGNTHLNLWAVMVEASWRQAGYVMVLYLAGLKALDPSLREAAVIDGANHWQSFWHVVFPVLRPINVIIIVVTLIESLRAFDLVFITNGGNNGLELLSVLVTKNIVGEAQRIGFGSALGVVLLVGSLVPIIAFLVQQVRREEVAR